MKGAGNVDDLLSELKKKHGQEMDITKYKWIVKLKFKNSNIYIMNIYNYNKFIWRMVLNKKLPLAVWIKII